MFGGREKRWAWLERGEGGKVREVQVWQSFVAPGFYSKCVEDCQRVLGRRMTCSDLGFLKEHSSCDTGNESGMRVGRHCSAADLAAPTLLLPPFALKARGVEVPFPRLCCFGVNHMTP